MYMHCISNCIPGYISCCSLYSQGMIGYWNACMTEKFCSIKLIYTLRCEKIRCHFHTLTIIEKMISKLDIVKIVC